MSYLDIDAFFPFYNEDKHTHICVLFNDGTKHYVKSNIARYIPKLYLEAGLNLQSVHTWSNHILNAQSNTPLLLTDKLIFIPIKFPTQPYTPGYSHTFGYINFNAIAFYSNQEVMLKNQTILQTQSPTKFIEKKLRDANLLAYAYVQRKLELGFHH